MNLKKYKTTTLKTVILLETFKNLLQYTQKETLKIKKKFLNLDAQQKYKMKEINNHNMIEYNNEIIYIEEEVILLNGELINCDSKYKNTKHLLHVKTNIPRNKKTINIIYCFYITGMARYFCVALIIQKNNAHYFILKA